MNPEQPIATPPQPGVPAPARDKSNAVSTASLALGGVAFSSFALMGITAHYLPSSWIATLFFYITGLASVLAIVLGIVALVKGQQKATGITGIILGSFCGGILMLLMILGWLSLNVLLPQTLSDLQANRATTARLADKFSVTDIRYNEDGSRTASATITNNTNETHTVWLRLSFYDASGELISATTGWAKNIKSNESKQVETLTLGVDVSGFASAEYKINSVE